MSNLYLREYQKQIAEKAVEILTNKWLVYLNMEVRTGKTITSLEIAKLFGAKNVLFLTKKKAINSIQKDYKDFGYQFDFTVINNESLHLINGNFDLIILDEAHRLGTYPKPNKVTKLIKIRYANLPMIYLSGTPNPESYSQIYHQFWVSNYSPFKIWPTFYKWANVFVTITQRNFGYAKVNDYSNCNYDKIKPLMNEYFITYTQQEAGFKSEVNEHILRVKLKPYTYDLIKRLEKNKVVQGKAEVILADTAVKLMSKVHQMYSGTVKFESGNTMTIDDTKAVFIKDRFKDKKIAIFYKFKEEFETLKDIYKDEITDNLDEFNSTNKSIGLQIVSGREGISLSQAKYLVYYNIDFSALSYWQSRDRLTTMERQANDIFWIFSYGGIEEKVYKSVMNKKNYTLKMFVKDGI
jgi:DNA-binding transcriptional regulator YiaG